MFIMDAHCDTLMDVVEDAAGWRIGIKGDNFTSRA